MEQIERMKAELCEYRPPLTRRPDFDAFWEEELRCAKERPLDVQVALKDYPARYAKIYDVSFAGFDGTRIKAWYMVPRFAEDKKLPCLVNYHGFNGDRGVVSDFFLWLMAGMCVFTADVREQGGDTGNSYSFTGGIVKNVTTQGLMNPKEYYYKAVYLDSVRAYEAAKLMDCTDPARMVVHGISQGGGVGMAVSCLTGEPAAALLDVPSLSNLEERVWGENGAFAAVAEYLRKYPSRVEQVFETLSYFDIMNMAEKMRSPLFASVALKDDVCPARHFFAAYNRISSKKEITIYPFNGHDGARWSHWEKKLAYLRDLGVIGG